MAFLKALSAPVVFLAAFLLFLVEPMTAKRLLPALGGSAAVWITCLVFFQCALLVGYLYAHLVAIRLSPRAQAGVHTALLALAAVSLAVPVRPDAAETSNPLATTLWLLTAMIGAPFVALAATTPLVQTWHARTGVAPGWRLYALSNFGSILALVLYPCAVEPHFALATQRIAWGIGFAVFAVACAGLAWGALRKHSSGARAPTESTANDAGAGAPSYRPASIKDRALWVLLPAASSILLCAITAHLSQNIAAIPMLWVVPLAAYLLSFIVTFAGPRWYARPLALRTLALALGALGYLLAKDMSVPLALAIPMFVGALFVFCYCCHGELYRLRPAEGGATSFYLPIALGSALGAVAVGVIAPMALPANYDLALGLVFLAALFIFATWSDGILVRRFWIGTTAAMTWAAVLQVRALDHDTISKLRSFYGSLRVVQTYAIPGPGVQRTLFHGTIKHGTQVFNDQLRARPTSYYAPDSGVGLALRYCCGSGPRRVGAVGLGAGTIAAYGQPGDVITFYEIDPLVERLARARFAYLHESKAQINVVLGDARMSMERQAPQNYDVIALDAFSGDAVPVHLLTAEAIQLYQRHLKPNGVLAFHISSQYVDLAPMLALDARHAGMTALEVRSLPNDELDEFEAYWVLMSADAGFFRQPDVAIAARPIALRPGLSLWTDDFNSLLPLVKWTGIQNKTEAAAPGN